ncbi:hypothetical protein LguiB_034213 [Lonicera macranthoides]
MGGPMMQDPTTCCQVISDCDWIDLYAVLCDFRLSGIEMVGLEAIPGLFYFKVKKLMLPLTLIEPEAANSVVIDRVGCSVNNNRTEDGLVV